MEPPVQNHIQHRPGQGHNMQMVDGPTTKRDTPCAIRTSITAATSVAAIAVQEYTNVVTVSHLMLAIIATTGRRFPRSSRPRARRAKRVRARAKMSEGQGWQLMGSLLAVGAMLPVQ